MSKEADKKLSDNLYKKWGIDAQNFLNDIGKGYKYSLSHSARYINGKYESKISIDAGCKKN